GGPGSVPGAGFGASPRRGDAPRERPDVDRARGAVPDRRPWRRRLRGGDRGAATGEERLEVGLRVGRDRLARVRRTGAWRGGDLGARVRAPREKEGFVARYFSIRPAWTIRGRKFFGIRGFSGKPTHPPLTDFPVVCYCLAALFDVISRFSGDAAVQHDFFMGATMVIIVGVLVSLATALTGFWDWWKGIPRRKGGLIGPARRSQVWRTANWHMTVMLTVTAIVIVDIVVRWGQLHDGRSSAAVTVLSVVAAILVAFG